MRFDNIFFPIIEYNSIKLVKHAGFYAQLSTCANIQLYRKYYMETIIVINQNFSFFSKWKLNWIKRSVDFNLIRWTQTKIYKLCAIPLLFWIDVRL